MLIYQIKYPTIIYIQKLIKIIKYIILIKQLKKRCKIKVNIYQMKKKIIMMKIMQQINYSERVPSLSTQENAILRPNEPVASTTL